MENFFSIVPNSATLRPYISQFDFMSLGPCGGPLAETLPTREVEEPSFPSHNPNGESNTPTVIYSANHRNRAGEETLVQLYRPNVLTEGVNPSRITRFSTVLELRERFGKEILKRDPRLAGAKRTITFDKLHTDELHGAISTTYLRNNEGQTEMPGPQIDGYFYTIQKLVRLIAWQSIDEEKLALTLEEILNGFLKHPWVVAELTRARITSSPVLAGTKIARDIVSMRQHGGLFVPGLLGSF